MRKSIIISMMITALPLIAMGQSNDDDLYFVPKKSKKVATTNQSATATTSSTRTNGQNGQVTEIHISSNPTTLKSSAVTIENSQGTARDVDEYNRRYTYTTELITNDTVYIEDDTAPLYVNEGEWLNGGFEGTEQEYE